MHENDLEYVPWKRYIFAVTQATLTFTLASFFLGLYIMHHGDSHVLLSVLVGLLYTVSVVFSIWRMVRQFSLAAVMLMIPIAPLVILMIVVSLIHLLQVFK
jgi:hypothetical protein